MSAAEPDYAKSMRTNKDSPWYLPSITKNLVPSTRQLFEDYSHIPPEDVVPHVHAIRDKAWAIRSYPCTGLGRWLVPTINLSPAYATIQTRLRAGATLLDVGAHLGQDLRKLVFDGAPSGGLVAVDVASHWEVGYELFRDRGRFEAEFIEADILGDDPRVLALRGKMDIVWASQVLHQRSWEQQVRCCKRFVELSREGSLVVGLQIGHSKGHQFEQEPVNDAGNKLPKVSIFWQSPETVAQLWSEVSRETGTSWTVKADLRTWEEVGWDPDDQKFLPKECGVLDYVVSRDQ